ncbi:hypothetical protein O2K51_14285 [Apibacter raozihei]|uniref:hypothetical protein n=1 Tax=Apibacter raozihei TaxID=2500547 RepID=UPI000FE32207|nr:hypothetical protein [Apibacter raozihei]
MNYNLEIQRLLIKISQENNSSERKLLLGRAIEIADDNNDLFEGIDLRYQLMEEMESADERISLLKQSIQLADSHNEIQEAFDLRIQLIEEENDTSHCTDSFSAMAWLLEAVDNYKELFNEEDILWQYKWLAVSSIDNSSISYQQIQNILQDLKTRLENNGFGLGGYFVPELMWRENIGDIYGAMNIIKERDRLGRDGMSDCEACEQNAKIKIKLMNGNFDEALSDMKEMQMKKLFCAEVPFNTYCNLAYYLNKGNRPEARFYFNKALGELKSDKNTSAISDISKLINYSAEHNKQLAISLFTKYAHWQLNAEDKISFEVSLNFLKLFKKDEDIKLENLRPSFPFYKENGLYRTHVFFDYYKKIAEDLAYKFDARNKTQNYNKLLLEELSRL